MHTPDGFITSWICILMLLPAGAFILYALYSAQRWLTKEKALLMAGLAAVIFGFQMLNFPIAMGTSGHLIGASLVTILLGPEAALLVLAVVLSLQAVVYGDGGMLALGVNIFNMAIVASYVTHFVYTPLSKRISPLLAAGASSLAAVLAASLSCALFLGISGTAAFDKVIPAMLFTHLFIGLGEAVITTTVVWYVMKTKHGLIEPSKVARGIAPYVLVSTLCAALIVSFALPFTSSSPDGLESVALRLGFYEKAVTFSSVAPFQDYTLFGSSAYLSVLAVALLGMMAAFLSVYGIFSLIRRVPA